ncbi:MAG: HD domain-containing phosphohydrolase [Lachnospiraceae bacterium]
MKINFNDFIYACSYALDCVEHELLGATTNHGKRVAYISILLGEQLGLEDDVLWDIAACAVLHDNALTEYLQMYNKELFDKADNNEIGIHCTLGEANIRHLPFQTDITDVILYHHENLDGTGVFGKKAADTPIGAQMIHFADLLDVQCDLGYYEAGKENQIAHYLQENQGTLFTEEMVTIFLTWMQAGHLSEIEGDKIDALLKQTLPQRITEYADDTLVSLATFVADIIDYKSEITSRHSLGMAEKAAAMGRFYQEDDSVVQKLYLAGALHDIGKLVIDKDILEKPDKLNATEYRHIQTHAWYTYRILGGIEGFEDITEWASLHHEKLDGSGYPFGKHAQELSHKARMMACLDIYQALTEMRSYKESMPHVQAMAILRDMAQKNQIDASIVEDINTVFGE